jgi:DNA-binding transcriptional ArsR family regulator
MPTDQLSRTFSALADPTRRDLVARLTLGDATLTELAAPYAMSLQAVSKHLAVLERAGLVTRGKDAQRRPVHLQASVLEPVTDWLETYRRRAEERYRRLDQVLADMDFAPGTDPPEGRPAPTDMGRPSQADPRQTPPGGTR